MNLFSMGSSMFGMRVIFSDHVLKESTERTFPVSRHRSKRIHKKLVKRFGGEFKKVPCIYMTHDTIFAHPSYRAELEWMTVQR